MIQECFCCERRLPVELHHVAPREHEQRTACLTTCIKVPACIECHHVLSLWQMERTWPENKTRLDQVVLGIIDLYRLRSLRGIESPITEWLKMAEYLTKILVRPARTMPDIEPVGQVT